MDIRVIGQGDERKYTAVVSFRKNYYGNGSATFPLRATAEAWYETTLVKAIRGELPPLAERQAHDAALAVQRAAEALLRQPLSNWSEAYRQRPTAGAHSHGESRNKEYARVGELLRDKSLLDFQGQAGAQLIQQLSEDWKHIRERGAPGPLEDSTARHLLTAHPADRLGRRPAARLRHLHATGLGVPQALQLVPARRAWRPAHARVRGRRAGAAAGCRRHRQRLQPAA